MIFDLTILTPSECSLAEYDKYDHEVAIQFPNDKKSYPASLEYYPTNKENEKSYDVKFGILTMRNCILVKLSRQSSNNNNLLKI